uniref:Uncharacterized protein n=1 Tax=Panagrolaimus superbus TaxID=310955 RepID=A0A914YR58_9BILA
MLLKQINENALPMSFNEMFFQATESGTVTARVNAMPRLQLEMQNMHLYTQIDLNTCTAKVHSLEGCASCNEGAVLQITCSTDFGTAAAHVTCPDMAFPISCSKDGQYQRINLFFNDANVDSECKLRCPSKVTSFKLTATLKKSTLVNAWSKVAVEVTDEPSLVLELLKAGKELVESNYQYLIIVLIVTGIGAIVLLVLLKKFI